MSLHRERKDKENIGYLDLPDDFYDIQTKSLNPLRSWFHSKRQEIVQSLVLREYKDRDVVVDLACGNCVWNAQKIPVVGVDINKKLMDHAIAQGRLSKAVVCDIREIKLPKNYADIVVATEVLEHLHDYKEVISEIKRILKPNGVAIISVPYDTVLSMWMPLFGIQCFIQGYLFGNDYYKKQCGHVNHFSSKKIRQAFEEKGFATKRQFSNFRFTIFNIFKKHRN
jgi:ubiquinone/menaquinone biosynthesis C-methylase UbiE